MSRKTLYIICLSGIAIILCFSWNCFALHSNIEYSVNVALPTDTEYNITEPSPALPAIIDDSQIFSVQNPAKRQSKRLLTPQIMAVATLLVNRQNRYIGISKYLQINLHTFEIDFPFSAFW